MNNSLLINYKRVLLIILMGLLNISLVSSQLCPNITPSLGVSTSGHKVVCDLPGNIDFEISGYDTYENSNVTYYINFGDFNPIKDSIHIGSEVFYYQESITNDELKNKKGKVSHEYTESYCGSGKTLWEIQVRAVSNCNQALYQIGSTSMLLQEAGSADFSASVGCEYNVCLYNESKDFVDTQCNDAFFYMWDFGDGTTRNQIEENPVERNFCHQYKCPGMYDITLGAFSGYEPIKDSNGNYILIGSSCGADEVTKRVVVLPAPELTQKKNITVCTGEDIEEVILQDLDVCTYDWYNSDTKQCEKKNVCEVIGEKVAYSFEYRITGDDIGLELGTFYKEEEEAIIPAFKAINNTKLITSGKCIHLQLCYRVRNSYVF
jgi:hypothetical protein